MTKQVEATLTSNRGKVYRQIAAVFDSLPDRFTATELYNAAKLESTHADNDHAAEYRVALALIEKHVEIWTPKEEA